MNGYPMTDNPMRKESEPVPLRYYIVGVILIWSILIVLSLVWNIEVERTGTLEYARIEARTAFEKDVIYRRWNAMHGGVYVPVSKIAQPNPYLNVYDRDIETTSGKILTKINPAFMARQVYELALKTYGVKGHITSLNPIRPGNAPDLWEAQALKTLQTGVKEVSAIEEIEGERYMRLMRPLLTEKACLKCHAIQGYKLGDIRGGISVSVPMIPLIAIERSHMLILFYVHGLTWLIVLFGIVFGFHLLNLQIKRRQRAEEELRSHEKLQGILEMAGAVCHELNQPLQVASGYCELLTMGMDEGDYLYEQVEKIRGQVDRMGQITKKLTNITRYETKEYLAGRIIDIDRAAY